MPYITIFTYTLQLLHHMQVLCVLFQLGNEYNVWLKQVKLITGNFKHVGLHLKNYTFPYDVLQNAK